jgi:subtilisin family serine protease
MASSKGLYTEARPTLRALNKFAREVMQSSVLERLGDLDGTGQVIAVVDDGLDAENCLFKDPNMAVVENTLMPNHRKILCLNTSIAGGVGQHGTHTAGTAAGARYSSAACAAGWNGVAAGAKLYFQDVDDPNTFALTAQLTLIFHC